MTSPSRVIEKSRRKYKSKTFPIAVTIFWQLGPREKDPSVSMLPPNKLLPTPREKQKV